MNNSPRIHLNVHQYTCECIPGELFLWTLYMKLEFELSVYLWSSIKLLIIGFRMLLCLRLCVFVMKDKILKSKHRLNIITVTYNRNIQAVYYKYNYCNSTQLLAWAQRAEKVLHISCNMGMSNVPDMYICPKSEACNYL